MNETRTLTRTPNPAADPTTEDTGRRLLRALLLGGAVGGAVVWAVTFVLALGHDVDPAEALAVGAFVGFWGGAGLGSMVAATVPLSRYLPPDSPGRRTGSHLG
jgi:hypothetical protein